MASPVQDPVPTTAPDDGDDPMQGSGQEEEGEGDDIRPAGGSEDDSSEEEEEDEEEARRIREGFIVDEDEDEGEEEEEERRRRRKRRKRRHRREREEEEALEDEDLELLEENTGASFKNRLTRLRRGRDDESPPTASSSKRRVVEESSEDDIENDDLELPAIQDIHRIWDEGAREDEDEDMDDMDNFIEYEDDEEGVEMMDEREREEKRRERRRLEKQRRKALGRPELAGIDANAWDEIHEVFGDGHDYDWALVDEDDAEYDEEKLKPEMKYQDVFEPSEIRARMLTEDDDLIRAQDVPERMQLATSSLSPSSTLSLHKPLTDNDIDDAAQWVLTRLSTRKERDFFRRDGQYNHLLADLVQAASYALRYLFVHEFEVPYIWTHKRDYISYFNPADMRTRVELLSLDELWRLYSLGQKYRSLMERRHHLDALYARLGVSDEYFENEIRRRLESVEVVADATEWLGMKYKDKKKDQFELHFHDDEEPEAPKRKNPSRTSAYQVAKNSVVARLAQGFGITPHEIVLNFLASNNSHFVEDQEVNPTAYAEQFADPNSSKIESPEELLRRARLIISTELGKDPLLRQEIRNVFKSEARISVSPTERGITKIDEHHPYYNFKYLHWKRVTDMLQTPQFLHILAAESEHLVTVSIFLPPEAKSSFERRLNEAFASDSFSDTAKAWNEERSKVVQETIEQHLLPLGMKWTREWVREEVEDFLANRCGDVLRERIDVAPFNTADMQLGDTPSVLAMSWGKGDPQKDDIALVFLDEAGRLREHTRLDNLVDADNRHDFRDLLKRRKPDVIAIGGFSITTTKLAHTVKDLLKGGPMDAYGNWPEEKFDIPVIYMFDEVARLYQHSNRASEEFGSLSEIAKYCVGLARYAQNPLNEYAALGGDVTAITFEEDFQQLIPREKLLTALERVLVDIVNKVGVDINRAVTDSYYQHLLPYICGLGPRKAQLVVKKIASMGGNLVNREQFVKNGLLTTKIFLNAAGFLRITHDIETTKSSKNRHNDDVDTPDPLDNTRIHPEDYELARKMATDALELDEEDIQEESPSHVVSLIMQDDDSERKLDELNLDDFAVNMYENSKDRKRHTLNVIRRELIHPFAEQRSKFPLPSAWEVLTMLTGETPRTLRIGLIVSVLVVRPKKHFVAVRLDSGIEGMINAQYLADQSVDSETYVKKGQTIPGVIIDVKLNLQEDQFSVELSSRPADVQAGDSQFRRVKHDEDWNLHQEERDKEMQARKKRAEVDRTRRVIKHPNFHNFNASQAEAYLDKQQRGDVVIRPSSKGFNHLAVTWKVDDKLFQHLDVVEPNADPTGQAVGTRFIVDGKYEFADLDELIVNHVQAMARRVEELMAHEKFKHGSEEELHLFLKNFVAANPSKSAYGFTLNRKRPGHFNLCFLANKNSTVQSWPVRVAPEAYYLFDTAAPGVQELCDAFKIRHLHESQNLAAGGAGGKTPYGAGRTPARTPGHMTPGHMSVRQSARTPNPYGGTPSQPGPPAGFGSTTPSTYGMPPPQTTYGYQTPSSYPPRTPAFPQQPAPPSGMNPARAAMIQQSGGWGTGSGGTW
ncbi:transcription elongation factor Spt6 [Gloeophyllum trabeum ATCC 11539]|uniref:Transcription elongation factor Spt6 n=1 Tax=Gloeophyllum trabeum (strain ATCC 11539 / FP-39264 / Madison 617) TaxID=670483 RepID=S7QF83_GLOTA|nr:transcription elongation factor Spt6 [Gloeophyllum trabeum ATCC 11539]EPQ58032.1 transcription elongation factor Spt6 [Gloeophyllum trabeum ATCC 11539]